MISSFFRLAKKIGNAIPLIVCFCSAGCQTASFYSQAIEGQFALLRARQPITKVLTDPVASDSLKRKLSLVLDLRQFAARELHLPVDDHYLTYADLGRQYAVWNVHAAPEFSLKPKVWWYPWMGGLTYRGYFRESDAQRYGEKLRRQRYDVYIEGVETYSTLGWFKDPLLNPLTHHTDTTLAEILFHELAHQKVFLAGDTDFNEAFATMVAEEGVKRWLRSRNDPPGLARYEIALRRQRQFVNLIMRTREKLEVLYRAMPVSSGRHSSETSRHPSYEHKQRLLRELRVEYGLLKAEWGGYSGYDPWFNQPINNAQLNSVAAYFELVPGFERILEANQGDLKRFYDAADAMRKVPKTTRSLRVKRATVNP